MVFKYPFVKIFTELAGVALPKMRANFALTIFLIVTFGCNTQPNKERLEFEITQLEDELSELYIETGRSELTIARSASLRDAYLQYANTWTGDSLAAEYLFQAAMIDADINEDVSTGIVHLERIIEEYPDHPITPKTLFLIGFTYAEQLNDYNKARDAYNMYLALFPEGEMAESVRIELETLGLRPQIDVIPEGAEQ
jgi:tetratricopeptide (TPR) repeat protein